jgi:hypothetical protein
LPNKFPAPASLPPPSVFALEEKLGGGSRFAGAVGVVSIAFAGASWIGAGKGVGAPGLTTDAFAIGANALGFSTLAGDVFISGASTFFIDGAFSARGKSTKPMGRKSWRRKVLLWTMIEANKSAAI